MDEDRQVVAAVLAGRPRAFEALVRRHERLVWHLVFRMVQHPEETRELCQEVYLRVHQRLHQFRFESALSTWIGRIAFGVASRHLRKRRIPLQEPGEDDARGGLEGIADGCDLQERHEREDMAAHLARAVARLPPLQRTVVTLYHLDELGIAEIALITGMPAGTIKSHLFRARVRLRHELPESAGERE
ncbi:sigma-70 family RNA polymerase sigma factor [Luteimonas sp. RD2P54]|uniref:Sigma-70 family RNA polymerase sigma factor n=1 Tax=Luteimonas endophytica TaxID=3042023 RepID=A0ABT6J4C6_9GAMM|nr:sigma-70 family RNA polymerase sigma factor [Luteimonas endophytica]MDH5821465.1 sigma-70 family RNA polymerase sigma factor [Luteimonas endophytica]